MATKKTAGAKSAPLDPKVADKLLDLLSTDNEFRRLFKKDPQAALAKVGHPESKAAVAALRKGPPFTPPGPPPVIPPVWDCMSVQRIAPKAEIIRSRDTLKSMFTSGLAYLPVQLDAASGGAERHKRK
ncbi:MAG: NHLP-related RiPP peptide [Luteimonas sp.]